MAEKRQGGQETIKHIVYPLGEKIEELLQKRIAELNLAEVVRCKDCVHNQLPPTRGNADCELWYGMTDLYGYCHYGKRREKDDVDA